MAQQHNYLARILDTQPETLIELETKLNKYTGKSDIFQKIIDENEMLSKRALDELGLDGETVEVGQIFEMMVNRIKHMDHDLLESLHQSDLNSIPVCAHLCDIALQLAKPSRGFFLKKAKATDMLEKFPPVAIMEHFGYDSVQVLLNKHDSYSIYAALRFSETTEWMHEFFNAVYDTITPDDFEERDVILKVLDQEWLVLAQKFLKKKYHNVSHLKELGVIFVIPITIDAQGEILRIFMLILHYLNEIPFYSRLFKKYSEREDFTASLKSLLRGDVPGGTLPNRGHVSMRIVQRYIAKDNDKDFRLSEPHVNPEAFHWDYAERDFARMATLRDNEGHLFGYWHGLDWVGGFFKSANDSADGFMSFNLIDLTLSLLKQGDGRRLAYHQHEALWNKIFIEYLGKERLLELIEDNIVGGFINL